VSDVKRWWVVGANLYENMPGGFIPMRDPTTQLEFVVLAADYDAMEKRAVETENESNHLRAACGENLRQIKHIEADRDRYKAMVERVRGLSVFYAHANVMVSKTSLDAALDGPKEEATFVRHAPTWQGCVKNQRGTEEHDAKGRRHRDLYPEYTPDYFHWDRRKVTRRNS